MSNPWFRFYSKFMFDPDVEELSFEDQRHFVFVLCMKCEGLLDRDFGDYAKRERAIARRLGLQGESYLFAKQRLIESGLINEDWQPRSWDKLQFASDFSSQRTRNWREKKRKDKEDKANVSCNDDETSQERHSDAIRTDTEQNRTEQSRAEEEISTNVEPAAAPAAVFPKPEEIVTLYHTTLCPPLPKIEKLTPKRRRQIKQLICQDDLPDLRNWRNFFHHVKQSDFLMGRAPGTNGRPPFRADLEWLTMPDNFMHIAEGRYHRG